MHPTGPPATRRRELATALREALELVPWSLRSLAKTVGLSHATLGYYKTGSSPTPETLERLGQLLEERGRALVGSGRELQRLARRRQQQGIRRLNADLAPQVTRRLNADREGAPARVLVGPLYRHDDAGELPTSAVPVPPPHVILAPTRS